MVNPRGKLMQVSNSSIAKPGGEGRAHDHAVAHFNHQHENNSQMQKLHQSAPLNGFSVSAQHYFSPPKHIEDRPFTTLVASIVGLLMTMIFSSVAWAEDIKTPEAQFDGYPTNLDNIPADWTTSNPISRRVCFNLVYPVNSTEANAFLRELHNTISSLNYDLTIQIERTIYPIAQSYCVSLTFPDWEISRRYESNPEFLDFYTSSWKPAVRNVTESLTVVDLAAAGKE